MAGPRLRVSRLCSCLSRLMNLAGLGIRNGNTHPLQRFSGSTVDIDPGLFIRRLCSRESRFRDSQSVLRDQDIVGGLGSEFLFLFGDIEGTLGQIASLLQGIDTGLSLLESELRVSHVETNALFLLLEGDLAPPIFQRGSELICLGLAIAQVNRQIHPHLVFRRGVIEGVLKHVTETCREIGSALSFGQGTVWVFWASAIRSSIGMEALGSGGPVRSRGMTDISSMSGSSLFVIAFLSRSSFRRRLARETVRSPSLVATSD